MVTGLRRAADMRLAMTMPLNNSKMVPESTSAAPQEDRGMIRGSPCRLRIDPAEIERTEIKRVDKHVNHTNRVVLIDPIIQAFGKQCRLPAIRVFNKAPHPIPRKSPLRAKRITTSQSAEAPRFYTARVKISLFRPKKIRSAYPSSGPSLRSVDAAGFRQHRDIRLSHRLVQKEPVRSRWLIGCFRTAELSSRVRRPVIRKDCDSPSSLR